MVPQGHVAYATSRNTSSSTTTMSLLSGSVQPPLLTLLSSTSRPSLSPLFKTRTDTLLPKDSLITSLTDSHPILLPPDPSSSATIPKHKTKGQIAHSVIHIQSPTVPTTYIQAGASRFEYQRSLRAGVRNGKEIEVERPLGVELEWVGVQFSPIGRRGLAFEFGVLDSRGREGVVRCSSFKKDPTLHPHRSPPLIHLPLNLPKKTDTTLTPWLELSLHLPTLLAVFQKLPRPKNEINASDSDEPSSASSSDSERGDATTQRRKKRKRGKGDIVELPSGGYGGVTYVRVYANCRLRRIWFSADGDRTLQGMGAGVRDEWGLYAAREKED